MKKLVVILLLCSLRLFSQEQSLVYLIGDAGEDTVSGEALLLLKQELLEHPNSTVIFLGDNVYPNGLKKGNRVSEKHLESQLQILREFKGKVYFIPGNHDWDAQKKGGLKVLKDQEEYVNGYLKSKSAVENRESGTFFPANGLPGPESVMLGDKLRLVMIDTQWFLHFYRKNSIGSRKNTKNIFYHKLDSLLTIAKSNGEQVIIAAHHPLYSNGQHGRYKQPWRFLVNRTPFQIFGLLGLNRLYSQDLSQPRYKKMKRELISVLGKYGNITFASGHDHNLQCFKIGKNRYIVSGSGSKLSDLRRHGRFEPVYQDDTKTGFIRLEYSGERIRATIFRSGEKELLLENY